MRERNIERASLKYLKPLLRYVRKYWVGLIAVVFFAVVGTLFTIIGPSYIRNITDLISAGLQGAPIDIAGITKIGIMLAIMYFLAYVFSYFQSFIMNLVTMKTTYGLRQDITSKINRLPLKYFDNTLIGDILSRVTNDVDTVGMTMAQSVGNLFHFGTQFLGSLVLMFIIEYRLALVALAAALLGFIIMTLIMSRSHKFFVRQQRELGALNGHVEEIYSGHNVVRAYNAEDEEREKFDTINGRLRNAAWKAQFFGGTMPPIMGFVGNLGYVAVCVVGSVLALNGHITFGVVVAFTMYIRLFTNPLQQLGQVFTQLQSTAAASRRVFEFLEEQEMDDESQKPRLLDKNTVKGEIVFDHVKFGYYPDHLVIKDFSAVAKAGQKVAIVGPTGAGKTTIVNLLMRFYDVNEGRITIDGVNINDMSREEIHDLFGMVLQDTWLFEGTFRDNIKYSKDATDEEIIAASKAAGIHHFIMTMPQGYDTILNEEASVSQGQKQLITIARAMVENAPFLILDEATSSVDTRTEVLIQEAMDKLMAGRTSFIIAHRLSTIKNADLILVMKEGDIIEQGSHDELIAQNGFYADLYNSQFEQID
ncbi:MAG: ABC transporter ATP-binding protein [Lachnospiraceae bacterium]|nr:ABC transporter ATP-binding protein [Lachnospiraceae bacterium]